MSNNIRLITANFHLYRGKTNVAFFNSKYANGSHTRSIIHYSNRDCIHGNEETCSRTKTKSLLGNLFSCGERSPHDNLILARFRLINTCYYYFNLYYSYFFGNDRNL